MKLTFKWINDDKRCRNGPDGRKAGSESWSKDLKYAYI